MLNKEAQIVSQGIDADIYRQADLCLKKYHSLGYNFLRMYQDATRLAQDIVGERHIVLPRQKPVTLSINPISDVVESPDGSSVYTVSPFIDGPILSEKPQVYNRLFEEELRKISWQISEQSGYDGVKIVSPNVKIRETQAGVTFVVTDIFAIVSDLRKRETNN